MLRAFAALRSSKDPRALLVGGASLRARMVEGRDPHNARRPRPQAPCASGPSCDARVAGRKPPPRLESPPVAGLLPEQRAVLDRWRSLSHALGGGSEISHQSTSTLMSPRVRSQRSRSRVHPRLRAPRSSRPRKALARSATALTPSMRSAPSPRRISARQSRSSSSRSISDGRSTPLPRQRSTKTR